MNPSPRIQKKYEQKNVLPARARDIYHPSYTFSSAQYRRYNTASALPPGGDPSQRVRVLTKSDFPPLGTHHFFFARVISRGFCFFCILDESRVSVGLRNSFVNVGLSYSFAKIFCTDKAPFCTDVSVSSPKFFLSFLLFFQKWSHQILYKTS